MSTDAQNAALRTGLGTGLVLVAAILLGWPLGFIAAVFVGLLAGAPAPLPVAAALRLVGETILWMVGMWILFSVLRPYPVVSLIAVLLLVVWVFHMAVRGAGPLDVILRLLAVLLISFTVGLSQDLAGIVALWLPINIALALLVTQVMFVLWPSHKVVAAAAPKPPAFDPDRRLLRMSLVTLPFLVVFYLLNSGAALTLIFVAILCAFLVGASAQSSAFARKMMASNLIGGCVVVLVYELLVMVTFTPFMALLLMVCCLSLALWKHSGVSTAPLAGSALTAFVILIGGALAPFGEEADTKMITRLIYVGGAFLYIVTAYVLVDHWLPERVRPVTSRRKRGGFAARPRVGERPHVVDQP